MKIGNHKILGKIMIWCIVLMMMSVSFFAMTTNAEKDNKYFIIQFTKMPSMDKREQLSSFMKFHRYLGAGRFVCEVPSNSLHLLPQQSIKGIKLIEAKDKISSELFNAKGNIDVIISTYELKDVNAVAKKIEAMGGNIVRKQERGVPRIWANVDSSIIDDIANIPEVYYMELDVEETVFLDKITTVTYMGMDAPQAGGFTGSGIMGEVQDNGCDMSHPDFEVDFYDGTISVQSHGTCTYGIVFSLGTNDMKAQGILYDAVSVFADYSDNTEYDSIVHLWNGQFTSGNTGMHGLFQSNSWGHLPLFGYGGYSSYAAEADQASYDHPHVLILWAAANSNNGVQKGSLSYEAQCKNGLTVGAVWHKDTADMSDDEWANAGAGNTPSQGPCADGRQKPDVVGPFDWIYCTDVSGGGGYSSGDYYDNFGGTSGATPCVAGIVGLAYEMYIENHFGNNPNGDIPSSAMIKALIIADAYQYPLDRADRDSQGWGSADAEQIYNLGADYHVLLDNQSVAEGGSWSYSVYSDGSMPLKITLAWIDPPAPENTGSARALRNNLDLKVTGPDGTIWYGNNGLYNNLWSISGTAVNHWSLNNDQWDDLNNVENVFIQNPTAGVYTIEVFGRSGDMYSSPQTFAIAAAGAKYTNQPPTCSLTASPSSGEAPLTTTFYMNASDPDGYITSWELDVDNDGIAEYGGNGNPPATQQHTYTEPGDYTAKLTVWDDDGATGYDTTLITVTQPNTPPNKPTDPDPPNGATDVSLNPTLSVYVYDPDGDTMDVSFYDGSGNLIGTDTNVASGSRASVTWSNLDTSTTYYWYAVADDGKGGTNTSDTWYFTTTSSLPPEKFYATQDISVSNGGITGDYTYTHETDDQYEAITETTSKGKPSSRYSYLEHKWTIDVTGGYSSYVFYLEAYHTSNGEGDDFIFAYSTDDVNYVDMLTVTKTVDDNTYQTFVLPDTISGTIYIRVIDKDRTAGNTATDTIYIDHMYIEASGVPPPNTPPNKPTDPDPPNGATDVSLNPTLSVYVYDPDGDTMDVSFYDGSGNLIGTDTNVASGSRASVTWSNLDTSTTYYWYAVADDGKGGTNTSDTWYFTTTSSLPPEKFYATQDISVSNGGITGDYTYTHETDDQYEAITETTSKGKPSSRYSYLEHKWTIDVTGGYSSYVFYLEAYHTSNGEGDDFIFAYSTDDVNYVDMLTVTKTVDDNTYQTFVLPDTISGTIYIRVIDKDRTAGNTATDTIYIDHMYIEAS